MATKAIVKYRSRPAKRRRRRSNSFTIPLAVAAPVAYLGIETVQNFTKIGATASMAVLVNQMTGYDPRTKDWKIDRLKYGFLPIVMGVLAHKVAGKLGVNRALGRAGLPFIRI